MSDEQEQVHKWTVEYLAQQVSEVGFEPEYVQNIVEAAASAHGVSKEAVVAEVRALLPS